MEYVANRRIFMKGAAAAAVGGILAAGASTASAEPAEGKAKEEAKKMKILIAVFSRADENYGVGYVTEGNTLVIAKMIAKETGGELFHLETVKAYPKEYTPCTKVAGDEKRAKARPEVMGDRKVEEYDTIYLGYPNWWGDMPMAVYTFIEKHNWNGKTVIPFCTHEGSGLGGTERSAKDACKGATFKPGLGMRGTVAQKSRDKALESVKAWLAKNK